MRGPGDAAGRRLPAGRPPRPPHGRRRRIALFLSVVAGAVALVVILVAYGVRGPQAPHPVAARADGHRGSETPTLPPVSTTVPPSTTTTTTTTGPGTLPQTTTLPSPTTAQFHAEAADLWKGVVTGDVRTAMPAFFPLGAYLQLKSIPDPAQDWNARLVGDFGLDIAAAHALLGSGASSAQLVGVDVPTQYAHWVTPGVCYNSVGYYEVPNARVVYRIGGVVRSFGIASMISWRGGWYLVHLGAVLRTTPPQGIVDTPATGPGISAYSSTC